jgi:chemotaxis protein methyltransferase CheR
MMPVFFSEKPAVMTILQAKEPKLAVIPPLTDPVPEPLMVSENSFLDISDEELAEISHALLFNRGFNLDAYKDRCVRRRIAIRVRATHCASVKEYCDHLHNHKPEIDHLLKVLTIHVSQFFRNYSTFEKLQLEIFPYLFDSARSRGAKELKVWSLGCASGEEPYTLALILAEHFSEVMKEIPVLLEATDIDNSTLVSARAGLFAPERMQEMPEQYLVKYFRATDSHYQLAQEIIDMVSFKIGDMFNNLLYHSCDLILCRNVMIYFSREQQDRIFRNIASVLSPDGFMVLGKSETLLGESRALFQTVCPIERIYRPAATGAGTLSIDI